MTVANESQGNYNYIFLSDKIDNIEFAYLIYNQIDPSLVIAENKNAGDFGKYILRKYGNVYITSIPDTEVSGFVDNMNGSVLYTASPTEKIESSILEMVDGLTGAEMFFVIKKRS